ncbi:hypothetical protein LIA77_11435 [Sarocladium implicatum]|nr:hypothetical protein LIA77_11435 [Sarocladium implicatum]
MWMFAHVSPVVNRLHLVNPNLGVRLLQRYPRSCLDTFLLCNQLLHWPRCGTCSHTKGMKEP